jgi:hypothetical protein
MKMFKSCEKSGWLEDNNMKPKTHDQKDVNTRPPRNDKKEEKEASHSKISTITGLEAQWKR